MPENEANSGHLVGFHKRYTYTDVEECLYKTKTCKHNFPQAVICNAVDLEFVPYFPDLH